MVYLGIGIGINDLKRAHQKGLKHKPDGASIDTESKNQREA